MRFHFTPAAERALAAAAGWTNYADDDALHPAQVLLGLLAEPDCRAALLLAPHGVDLDAARQRFSELKPRAANGGGEELRFSDPWWQCLHTAESLLIEYPQPLELATEHLLLGIAATPGEVSLWLRERGLDVETLEAEIHRLSGHQPGPLPFETEEEADELLLNTQVETPQAASEHQRIGVLRIVDAAANRAAEGLRVVEDFVRFVLDDRHLTSVCKQMRHDLAAALATISTTDRHRARETRADVGVDVSLPSEQARATATAVVEASFKRVEQALRSLEEFGKTLDASAALTFEQLRYRAYTLERAVDITRTSGQRLAAARLYVLVEGGADAAHFGNLVRSLVEAGVSIVQLRDKHLADRELLARARQLRDLTRDTPTLAIVNDRPDLCVLSDADGVHVGQEELTVKDARRIVGPSALVGVSTHSIEQARAAVLDGADYIGVGPTFPSATKQFAEFTGVDLLRAVSAEIRLSAFAIGGITAANVAQVRAAGFTRIAVSAAVTAASEPGQAAAQLRAALGD